MLSSNPVNIRMRFRIRGIRFVFVYENIQNLFSYWSQNVVKGVTNPIPCESEPFSSL
jgi:hypothetical protein